MTDNTQAAFEKGRAKAFQAIRDMIRLDIDKMAVSAVNDQLGFGQSPEPHLVSPVKAGIESLHNHCTAVLDALEAGETVYSLTGADTIRTYRNITGGDELAGAMSAVEDMKVMLFSMDLDEIGKPFSKPAQVKSQHDESQVAASYRGARKAADPFMSHGLAIAYETILLRIEEKIARKIPAPKVIGLNGEAPQMNKQALLRTAFRKLAEQEHASASLMRRAAKVPNLWPPLKNGMQMPGMDQTGPGKTQALPEPDQTPNDNEEFAEGYTDALRLLFRDMQEDHFKSASASNDYAQKVGFGPSWEGIVSDTAREMFNNLRMDMQERIQGADARGPGETYADGFEAARDWVKYKISALEVKQSWDRTPNKEQAANKLRSFWMKQTDSIIDSVTGAATMQTSQPAAEKRKQAKRKAPGL